MRALVIAVILSGFFSAHAEDTTLSSPSDSASQLSLGLGALKPKKFEEDRRITDLELKAQSGSLNRYSAKFTLGFDGPAINELYNPNRPIPPDGRSGDNHTKLSGYMGLRYRATKDTALTASTGVLAYTPYQAAIGEDVKRPRNSKTYDISDPGLGIDHTYLLYGVQARSSFSGSYVTNDYYSDRGQWGTFNVGQGLKWIVAQSRVTLGAKVSANYFAFGRPYRRSTGKTDPGDGKVSRYNMNLIPSVEYKIVDSLNFNTSLGYSYQNLRSEPSKEKWNHQLSTWRVGVGWAAMRDVYLNPYVNFFAEKPAFNTASLNVDTVFSVF